MKMMLKLVASSLLLLGGCKNGADKEDNSMQTGENWPSYGGNKAGNRYSPLTQINLDNVKNLQVAWMYDAREPLDSNNKRSNKEIQCQPIVVNGVMYGTTPELKLFAIEAATGKQIWKFTPASEVKQFNSNRGVMYWEDGDDKRILYTAYSNLYAINATTGQAIASFGNNGKASLYEGLSINLDYDVRETSVTATSPGVIYKNTLVIGSSVSEGGDAAPGHIRAFDVVTGKLKWVFHTVPQPGEFGYDTWPKDAYKKIGGANCWSGMVVDEKRGLVCFGTGSPSSDFYGGDRAGANLFANCILALDAESGKMKWYFQTVHHDLWDRDIPCPPNLATVTHNGKKIDVVVQATKDGYVYVLNREDGTSLFPVEERAVPTTGLPGEHPYPTQKFPLKPLPFSRQIFTEADMSDISPETNEYVKKRWNEFGLMESKYQPPSVRGTLLQGYSGGAEWGGNSVDPDGILYQNANHDFWELLMEDAAARDKKLQQLSPGRALYGKNCAACHGADRKGSGAVFPSLVNIGAKRTPEQIHNIIKAGSGRMPSFKHLEEKERNTLVNFLLNKEKAESSLGEHANADVAAGKKNGFPYEPAYVVKKWTEFADKDGYNAIKPPWGTLNAIDLNTGEYLWTVPLGEFPELTAKGIPITGTKNYGGPVTTASGLIFIAATKDERIRAFDKNTGKVVWEYQLPAGGFATPVTYEVNGKQYVAIAAGGGRGKKPGGWYIAFALK
jgi:quinoprotein glucose dehydrogenase